MGEKSKIKSLIVGGAITLIITLIGAYFAFFLSRSTVDLKYTLSEGIVINTQGESVQQLEIKNLGNAPAEKIVINIDGDIKAYSIAKNAENDSVQEFSKADGLQIIYPELPPQSGIKIALTLFGSDGSEVSISHSKGLAKEALSASSSGGSGTIVTVLYFFVLCVNIWLCIKYVSYLAWSRRAIRKYDLEKIFKRTSPPALIKHEWVNIRELALQTVFLEIIDEADKFYSFPVTTKKCFKFLENKLFANYVFSVEEKTKLVNTAQETVKLLIHMKFDKIYDLADYKELLELEKPELLAKDNWSNLRDDIITSYCRAIRKKSQYLEINKIDDCEAIKILSNNLDFLYNGERASFVKTVKEEFLGTLKEKIYSLESYKNKDIVALCQTPKPSFILQHEWEEVMTVAKQYYVLLNLQKMSTWSMKKEDCEEVFAQVIPQSLQGKEWNEFVALLEKYYSIFAFEDFLKTFSSEKILENFQTDHIYKWKALQDIIKKIENSNYINKAIMSAKKDFANIFKPEGFSEPLANSIETYIKEKELLSEELAKASEARIQFTKLKEKVLAQLEFINTVLEFPLSIERVEDYEDIFSKGNYENLKKVVEVLRANCQ